MNRARHIEYDSKQRAADKVAARSSDSKLLASGAISPRALHLRNGFLAAADFSKVVILGPRRASARG